MAVIQKALMQYLGLCIYLMTGQAKGFRCW